MLASCNLFEPQWDTERLKEPPKWGRPISPDFITARPDLFWNEALYVRGYIHYSGDDPTTAMLVPTREMVLVPPLEGNALWVVTADGVDMRGCHGEYVEVFGSTRIEELKGPDSDRIYALKPSIETRGYIDYLEWFGEVPSAFENPIPNPVEFEAVKTERLALLENDDIMTCVTYK